MELFSRAIYYYNYDDQPFVKYVFDLVFAKFYSFLRKNLKATIPTDDKFSFKKRDYDVKQAERTAKTLRINIKNRLTSLAARGGKEIL